jgi:hypothetical protein
MDDLVELVRDDHARIDRLFGELEQAAGDPVRLTRQWAELADALLAHMGAFEEVCKLPFFRAVPDSSPGLQDVSGQKLDVCDAVAEARLQPAGSPRWWLAVRAARTAAARHASSAEAGLLPRFAQRAPESARQELGRQWRRYLADFSSDRREGARPD